MFDFILDLFRKEPTEAQIYTCFVLARKVYIKLYGHTPTQADNLAYNQVKKWIEQDRVEKALKRLWKSKVA